MDWVTDNNKRSMENTELKHLLIAYKSTNIGLQQAHDEILRLFNVVERSELLFCYCSQGKGVDIDEDGFPYCIDCQKNIAK